MNKLSRAEQVQIVSCLVEGNSLRATTRMTGIHRTTILKLLEKLGAACSKYQDETFRNLTLKNIQCDEIWSFVGAKERNCSAEKKKIGWGDVWTWVAIDRATKLVPSFRVGDRDAGEAYLFIHDLASRLAHRVQLHHGRPQGLSLGGRGRLWVRNRLRHADQALWQVQR